MACTKTMAQENGHTLFLNAYSVCKNICSERSGGAGNWLRHPTHSSLHVTPGTFLLLQLTHHMVQQDISTRLSTVYHTVSTTSITGYSVQTQKCQTILLTHFQDYLDSCLRQSQSQWLMWLSTALIQTSDWAPTDKKTQISTILCAFQETCSNFNLFIRQCSK